MDTPAKRDLRYLAARLRDRADHGTALSEDDERYLSAVHEFVLTQDRDLATALDAIARSIEHRADWPTRQKNGARTSLVRRAERVEHWHGEARAHLAAQVRGDCDLEAVGKKVPEYAEYVIGKCEAQGIRVPGDRSVRDYMHKLLRNDPKDWDFL